jgi:hypothetical protein
MVRKTMRLMYVTRRPAGHPPAHQYESRMGASGPAGLGPTIVAESRSQVSILFGFLTLAFAVALVRGGTGAQTRSGRVAVVVLCGVLLAVFISAWIRTLRHLARLEITEDAIRYVRRNGQSATLSRQQANELYFVRRNRGGRIWTLGLAIMGTDTVMDLGLLFSRRVVRQACLARDWRFR